MACKAPHEQAPAYLDDRITNHDYLVFTSCHTEYAPHSGLPSVFFLLPGSQFKCHLFIVALLTTY